MVQKLYGTDIYVNMTQSMLDYEMIVGGCKCE